MRRDESSGFMAPTQGQTMFGLYDMLKNYLTQVTMLGDKYTQSCDNGYYPAILP